MEIPDHVVPNEEEHAPARSPANPPSDYMLFRGAVTVVQDELGP